MFKCFILTWNDVWNNIKKLAAKKFLKVLGNFLARSDMLENIHKAKLLQPITAYVDSCDILT